MPALIERFGDWRRRLHPGAAALLEIGLLFLPAIPAYLWMWPSVSGASERIAQIVTYFYVLGGTLIIGLRRWRPGELGVNRNGIGLSLACGAILLAGRLLIIQAVDFGLERPVYSLASLIGQILFYFGLVGLVEELLFRGLIYRALEEWRGLRWAIWGTSIGFILWHIFGQGPLGGAAGFLLGLIFALMRWRAGGILGLILVHGLYDLESALLVSNSSQEILDFSRISIGNLFQAYLGFAVMLGVPFYLWKLHPRVKRLLADRVKKSATKAP
jgi:membrane protease YdiL (CAAX protease family)